MSKVSRPPSYTDVQRQIGERIRWAREIVFPNRADLARIMGVDRTTLQKIEDGDRPPSVFNLIDLCHRLRVSPNYLLAGSMQGVDPELAFELGRRHPELRGAVDSAGMGTVPGTPPPPTKRQRA